MKKSLVVLSGAALFLAATSVGAIASPGGIETAAAPRALVATAAWAAPTTVKVTVATQAISVEFTAGTAKVGEWSPSLQKRSIIVSGAALNGAPQKVAVDKGLIKNIQVHQLSGDKVSIDVYALSNPRITVSGKTIRISLNDMEEVAKPAVKAAPKVETKAEAKPAAKDATKAAAKAEAKPAVKDAPKVETKAEAKPAAKDATKAAAKAEATPAVKDATKAAAKAEAKPAVKDAPKAAAKADVKPAVKEAPKAAAKAEAKPAVKEAPKAVAKTEAKPAVKDAPKAAAKADVKPTVKDAPKAVAKTEATPAVKDAPKAAAKASKVAAKSTSTPKAVAAPAGVTPVSVAVRVVKDLACFELSWQGEDNAVSVQEYPYNAEKKMRTFEFTPAVLATPEGSTKIAKGVVNTIRTRKVNNKTVAVDVMAINEPSIIAKPHSGPSYAYAIDTVNVVDQDTEALLTSASPAQAEAKPAVKETTEAATKAEAKPAVTETSKAAAKAEAKPAAKETPKVATKAEAKPAAKETTKVATKAEANPAAKETTKAAAKAEAKPAAKETTKAAAKAEAKPVAKETTKAAAKAEAKPAAKETTKAAAKAEAKPAAKETTAPANVVPVAVSVRVVEDMVFFDVTWQGDANAVSVKEYPYNPDKLMHTFEFSPAVLTTPAGSTKVGQGVVNTIRARKVNNKTVAVDVMAINAPTIIARPHKDASYAYAIDTLAVVDDVSGDQPTAETAPKVEAAPKVMPATSVETAPKVEAAPKVMPATSVETAPKVEAAPKVMPATSVETAPKVEAAPKVMPATSVETAPKVEAAQPAASLAPAERVCDYFPMAGRDVQSIVNSMKGLFPNVRFQADPVLNVILVEGSAKDVEEVRDLINIQ